MYNAGQAKPTRSSTADAVAKGRLLIDAGLITQAQLDICLRQQSAYLAAGRSFYVEHLLVMNRFVSKDQMQEVLEIDGGGHSSIFQQILPVSVCKRYKAYPLGVNNGVLELKASRRLTPKQVESIARESLVRVSGVKVIPTDLGDVLGYLSRVTDSEHTFELILNGMRERAINGAMLRQAIQSLLIDSINMRASDIHLDKKADPYAWASHRIDGQVIQAHLIPEQIMAAIFTKIKTEAGMDASDVRKAQGGRISIESHGRHIDFRVATQPLVDGETMTLRVLDPESLLSLNTLFPNQQDMSDLFKKISQVNGKRGGFIIFSGPTGGGKTTSLYALAQQFPRNEINVITVEDPVEYLIPFIRQIQLNQLLDEQAIGVERSLVRQDPDVIILGEIRDSDTMHAALKFAESGHLVLASIHADDVTQTFQRVLSFVEGAARPQALLMLANTLRVVVNQNLVRRLCSCAEDAVDTTALFHIANDNAIPLAPGSRLKIRSQCPRCQGTGYFSRVAAHETIVIPMDESLRSKIPKMVFDSDGDFSGIKNLPGVTLKRRQDTVARLVEAGVIDVETAVMAVHQEFN